MFSQYVILKNQVGAVNLAMGAGVSMGFQGIIRLPAVTSSCQPNPTLAGFALWLSLQDPVGIKTKSIRMMQIIPLTPSRGVKQWLLQNKRKTS